MGSKDYRVKPFESRDCPNTNAGPQAPAMGHISLSLARDGSPRLMVYAHDQQLVGVALIVDAERRDSPTSHMDAGSQLRHGAVKFLGCQALDALRDLCVETRRCCWVPFVQVGDRLDDVGDRFFSVGSLQRPRAESMI